MTKGLNDSAATGSTKRFRFQKVKERVVGLQTELSLHAKTQTQSQYVLHTTASTAPFHEELTLLGELYTNERFQAVFRQLRRITNSTPQLLHHLKTVVTTLEKQLIDFKEDPDVMVPVLKLFVALAKDLGKEFYPSFPQIFPSILAVITTTNPELTTEVFKTLSMLFKYLQTNLLADMHAVHQYFGLLLGHSKDYVREFAASVFCVLLRKVKAGKDFAKYIQNFFLALVRGSADENDYVRDGSARLFFAVMKNVQEQFHSRTPELLNLLLKAFAPSDAYTDDQLAAIYDIVRRTCDLTRKYTSVEHTAEVWTSLQKATAAAITAYETTPTDATALYLSRQNNLVALWVAYRQGELVGVGHKKVLYTTALSLLGSGCYHAEIAPELHASTLNLLSMCILSLHERFYPLLKNLYGVVPSNSTLVTNVRDFTHKMLQSLPLSAALEYLVPHAVNLALGLAATPDMLEALGRILAYAVEHAGEIPSGRLVVIRGDVVTVDLAKLRFVPPTATASFVATAQALFAEPLPADEDAFLKHAASLNQALECLRRLEAPTADVAAMTEALRTVLEDALESSPTHTTTVVLTTLHAKCLQVLSGLDAVEPSVDAVLGHLDKYATSPFTLQALRCYLKRMDLTAEPRLTFRSLFAKLQNNLRSPCQALRRETIDLFSLFPALQYENTTDTSLQGDCEAVALALQLEVVCSKPTVESERDIVRMLERFKVICRSPQTPVVYIQMITAHMLGLNHVKFSTIWPHVAIVVQACVPLHFEAVWGTLCAELYYISNRSSAPNVAAIANSEDCPLLEALAEDVAVEEGVNQDVTDLPTQHGLVWKTLEGFPNLVEQKSKVIVPIFAAFLRDQYYAIYTDDSERVPAAVLNDVISAAEASRAANPKYALADGLGSLATPVVHASLTTKAVREKLVSFMHLFKRFTNYAGVFGQQVLWDFFFALLIKSDDHVSALALQCIYAFKPTYILPYKIQLDALTNSTTFREALTNFSVDKAAGVVLDEHRAGFFPVLLRLLYAKFVSRKGSRSSKDSLATRRTTVLSFLVALETDELAYFIGLILRPFRVQVSTAPLPFADRIAAVATVMPDVSGSKQVGFLNLLEDVIAHLGMKVTAFLPQILAVLTAILAHGDVGQIKTDDAPMEELADGDEDAPVSNESLKRQTRMLVFRRLADVVKQFDGVFALDECFGMLFAHCDSSIAHLPQAMRGAKKPSALLDWLRAIAESTHTVRILPTSVVRTVLSCLSTGIDSDAVTAYDMGVSADTLECLLGFMGGLLTADEAGASLLLPHLTFVLEQFICRFKSKTAKFLQEKHAGSSKRELLFLCRLAPHVQTNIRAEAADQLITLLLPFLTRSYRTSYADKENVCDVVAGLVPCVADPAHHVSFLSKLIAPGPNCLTERGPRLKLMAVFAAIEAHPAATALASMCGYLVGLNAMDPKRLEEVDFERRLSVFQTINGDNFASLVADMTLLQPIISQYLYSMHDEEYSLRNAARAGLEGFTRLAAAEKDVPNSTPYHVFENVVMPCVRFSLKGQVEEPRRGFVQLLSTVADAFEGHENPSLHGDLSLLRNKEDPEVDFFYNMTHIQVHRRARALQRLRSSLDAGKLPLSNTTVVNVLVPLLTHVIYETTNKAQEAMATDAAQCLGSAASLLSWSHYYGLIRNLLKQIPGRPESENVIIAAVCAIIDHFHFEGSVVCEGWDKVAVAARDPDEAEATHVQSVMRDSLVPMLQSHLTKGERKKGKAKTGEKDAQSTTAGDFALRVPVALAIVKVLRRLPPRTFHAELPKLLIQVTKLQRSKDESVRSSSRQTLVKIALELGPSYLAPIVNELEHSLTMGYMVHVLSYTLFAILDKVAESCHQETPPPLDSAAPSPAPVLSPLDECVPKILAILVRDIFGDVGETRRDKAEHKSKMKEARSCRSYDSFELVARCINFLPNPTIHVLLLPIVQTLEGSAMDGKALLNVRNVLQRVALGLSKNKSVEQSHMYLYLYNMLTMCFERLTYLKPDTDVTESTDGVSSWLVGDWVGDEKKKAKLQRRVQAWETFKVEAQARMTGYDRYAVTKAEAKNSGADEIMNFSVSLLYTMLRKEERTGLSFALLDPFVPFLMRCLAEIKHNETVVHALKCLAVLLNHPVPSLVAELSPLVDRIFKLIQRAGAATKNEMTQTCYRALSILLRERNEYAMSDAQLRVLLSFLRQDLDEMDHQNSTFALLKALLARRLVIPEVYDLMLRVGEMMVQSQVANVRSNCAAMYLTFLLDYPLGDKRLNYHVRFLVNNLAFVYESGRLATLDCLDALVKKLPSDLLDARAQFFLLPLVLRLVNDEAQPCRALAADVISHLFQRVSAATFAVCTAAMEPWWASADAKLKCAAAHVSGLVVAARPELAKKSFLTPLLGRVGALLAAATSDIGAQDEDAIEELTWEPVYLTLLCLEKVRHALPAALEAWLLDHAAVLDTVVELMGYPHAWVRLAATRALGAYTAARTASTLCYTDGDTADGGAYLSTPGKLFALAVGACKQLESDHLVAELASEVVTLLLFILRALRSFPAIDQNVKAPAAADGEDDGEEDAKSSSSSPVAWLFTRLSFLARGYHCDLRKTTVYNFFAGVAVQEEPAFLETVLLQMLNPLYRDTTAEEHDGDDAAPTAVKNVAREVLQLLEAKVESGPFLAAYTHVQKKVTEFRERRKQKRKIEVVAEPEVAAKRKLAKNLQKQASKQLKKRKIGELKGSQNKAQKVAAANERRKKARPGHS
ncbi:U3 small nucleolar RNA-associated protein [Achlya hypogyna]|uniref:U3 small nucleolar RNA-associated protein n=1 Tax=Achlya hypogyna TaxID=1202772 RepID=A0A1V9Z4K2_ACHHY|nr:U3 small nucleolar RNA-associated protein [Achlya hypogyna]